MSLVYTKIFFKIKSFLTLFTSILITFDALRIKNFASLAKSFILKCRIWTGREASSVIEEIIWLTAFTYFFIVTSRAFLHRTLTTQTLSIFQKISLNASSTSSHYTTWTLFIYCCTTQTNIRISPLKHMIIFTYFATSSWRAK